MLLKHPMDLGELIRWILCWFYMCYWVGILNSRNWWSTAKPKMSEGAPFKLNKYMSRMRFEVILSPLSYTDKIILNIMIGSSTCIKWKMHGTITRLNNSIHHRLIYLTRL